MIARRKGFRKIIVRNIESTSNPLVKTVRRLARARKREPLFLIEGVKLVRAAMDGGTDLKHVVVARSAPAELRASLESGDLDVIDVDDQLFRHMSSLDSPEGVLALGRRPEFSWSDVAFPLVVVSVGIQDPGNLGAVARVAEATGVGALIVTKGSADPFGPKTVRGSMGSVLRLCILDGVSEETMIASLKARRFRLAATLPRGGIDFRQAVRERPLALVLGGESRGLPNAIVERCDVGLSIPMAGAVESLNVAMVAGIVLYEATREDEGGSS